MRNIIVKIMIPLIFIWTLNCGSMHVVSKEQFTKSQGLRDAEVLTNKNEILKFENGDYFIISDSLSGKGKLIEGTKEKIFSGKIALDDISVFSMKYDDTNFYTIVLISIGAVALLSIILLLASLSSLHSTFRI